MVSDINALLKSVNAKKNNLTRQYPPKLFKLSTNVINNHLCNMVKTQKILLFLRQLKLHQSNLFTRKNVEIL